MDSLWRAEAAAKLSGIERESAAAKMLFATPVAKICFAIGPDRVVKAVRIKNHYHYSEFRRLYRESGFFRHAEDHRMRLAGILIEAPQ